MGDSKCVRVLNRWYECGNSNSKWYECGFKCESVFSDKISAAVCVFVRVCVCTGICVSEGEKENV